MAYRKVFGLPKVDKKPSANPLEVSRIKCLKGGETVWTAEKEKPPQKPRRKDSKVVNAIYQSINKKKAADAKKAVLLSQEALKALRKEIQPHEKMISDTAAVALRRSAHMGIPEKFKVEAEAHMDIADARLAILKKVHDSGVGASTGHTEIYASHKAELEKNLQRASESIGAFKAKSSGHPDAARMKASLTQLKRNAQPYLDALTASSKR